MEGRNGEIQEGDNDAAARASYFFVALVVAHVESQIESLHCIISQGTLGNTSSK